jgi:hypothetical protein
MGLLQDMMPDIGWKARGGLDRDGSALSAVRARQINAATSIRGVMFVGLPWLSWLVGIGVHFSVLGLGLLCLVMIGLTILDWPRQVDVLELARHHALEDQKASSNTRIMVALLFFLPFAFMILMLIDMTSGRWLSHFLQPVMALVSGLGQHWGIVVGLGFVFLVLLHELRNYFRLERLRAEAE